MPKGWKTWAYWQYTDAEAIAGISGKCDCSVSSGSHDELLAMAGLAPQSLFTNVTVA